MRPLNTLFAFALLLLAGSASLSVPSALAQCVCIEPDNTTGTVDLPPNCDYLGSMVISTGLPVGTEILIEARLTDYNNASEVPGGGLGGHTQTYEALVEMQMSGTGVLIGFNRTIFVPVDAISESAPRVPGDAVQDFPTEMVQLQGSIFGDPDFDILTLRAGSGFGLPSPGHTTLTRLGPPGSDFEVESFFDVFYEIDFQGAPGSILDGFAGTTQNDDRFAICRDQPTQSENTTWGSVKSLYR